LKARARFALRTEVKHPRNETQAARGDVQTDAQCREAHLPII